MEIWKDIPGLEGFYQASSDGRIRSVAREVATIRNGRPATRISPSKVLKPHLNEARGGYYSVKISVGNRALTKAVHPLVCAAFHGPKPEGMLVAHNNGISTDNRKDNLRWDTVKANHADKARHGTLLKGERNGSAKLTEEAVRAIKASDENKHVLAARFGVSEAAIRFIREGRRWAHIT